MIKVTHVISDTGIGGAGIHLCNLLACADRETFSPSVILPKNSALIPRLTALQIPVVEIKHGADKSTDLRAVPEMTAILHRTHPHILHTHSAFYARVAGYLCRVPVAVNTRHCADMTEHPARGTRMAVGFLERRFETHTIATAEYVKDILVQQGISPKGITVIHNGSLPLPRLSEEEKQQLRAELKIGKTTFTVGMVARLAEGKGHETFLRAAKLCLTQNPDLCFLIVGSGVREKFLQSLAHELGIAHRVRFLGFRQDVSRIMNILGLNVNCSRRSETSSLSLSEGMSVGAVPIVADCGGNPFMAGFGENGVIFPIDDHQSLADAILSLSCDQERLVALSERCKTRFSQEFTAEAMTRHTEALYKQLLANLHKNLDIPSKI